IHNLDPGEIGPSRGLRCDSGRPTIDVNALAHPPDRSHVPAGMPMTETTDPEIPSRLREPPMFLLRKAMGDGPTRRRKLRAFLSTIRNYGDERQIVPRLQRLKELGWLDEIPT